MGQRYESLKARGEAAKIAHELDKPEESFLELHKEAIACMALRDVCIAQGKEANPDRLSIRATPTTAS
jgi:hypothetical protein